MILGWNLEFPDITTIKISLAVLIRPTIEIFGFVNVVIEGKQPNVLCQDSHQFFRQSHDHDAKVQNNQGQHHCRVLPHIDDGRP